MLLVLGPSTILVCSNGDAFLCYLGRETTRWLRIAKR